MKSDDQTHCNFKFQKLFDTCRLEGQWKRVVDSIPRHYIALEDGASIELSIIDSNFTESFRFKKIQVLKSKTALQNFMKKVYFNRL